MFLSPATVVKAEHSQKQVNIKRLSRNIFAAEKFTIKIVLTACFLLCLNVLICPVTQTHTFNGICAFLIVAAPVSAFQDWGKRTVQITLFLHSPTAVYLRAYRGGLWPLKNSH